MNFNQKMSERVDHSVTLADKTLATKYTSGRKYVEEWVNSELFNEFRSSAKSFIANLYGKEHPYYEQFNEAVDMAKPYCVEHGRGILKSIKAEIDNGWLVEIKELIASEIFSDFLEMAQYLLEEGYKDPAAVMIGSVIEENLRQLAQKNNINLEFTNGKGESKPKRADTLNNELAKSSIYSKLDQKQVTAWLDLRNKAAHGKYEVYTKEQVQIMSDGVLNFLMRNK